MPYNNHTPYDYIPHRLYLEEIGNPILGIHKFFDWENLPEWRNHLDKWLGAAYTAGFQLERHELVELFVRYEFFEYLIEALSLINHKIVAHSPINNLMGLDMLGTECNLFIPDQINTAHGYFNNGYQPRSFDKEAYYPKYLNNIEKKYPYNVIRVAFSLYNLPEFRDALYWWYIVGIDDTCSDDSRGNEYLNDLHQIMQKLIEAAHLIHLRHQ